MFARRPTTGLPSVEQMAAETIAAALAEVRHLQFVQLPPGYVALGTEDVEAAGLDMDEVRAWVDRHSSLRAGQMTARPPRTSTYFQIPGDLLDISRDLSRVNSAAPRNRGSVRLVVTGRTPISSYLRMQLARRMA